MLSSPSRSGITEPESFLRAMHELPLHQEMPGDAKRRRWAFFSSLLTPFHFEYIACPTIEFRTQPPDSLQIR